MRNVSQHVVFFHLLCSKESFEKIMITIIHVSLQKRRLFFLFVENNIKNNKALLLEENG